MRAFVVIPIAVLLTAGCGWGLCRLMGWDPQLRWMLTAAGASLVAGLLAAVPLILVQRGAPDGRPSVTAVSQAGLFGTLIHLMVLVIASGIVFFRMQPTTAFTYWLLVFYWPTLIALVATFTAAVRQVSNPSSPVQQAKEPAAGSADKA